MPEHQRQESQTPRFLPIKHRHQVPVMPAHHRHRLILLRRFVMHDSKKMVSQRLRNLCLRKHRRRFDGFQFVGGWSGRTSPEPRVSPPEQRFSMPEHVYARTASRNSRPERPTNAHGLRHGQRNKYERRNQPSPFRLFYGRPFLLASCKMTLSVFAITSLERPEKPCLLEGKKP